MVTNIYIFVFYFYFMNNTDYYFLMSKWKKEGLNDKERSIRYNNLITCEKNTIQSKKEKERFSKTNKDMQDKLFKDDFKRLMSIEL